MSKPIDKPDFFSRAILTVSDVQASVDYYRAQLGFEVSWSHSNGAQVVIAQVERAGIDLILQCGSGIPSSAPAAVVAAELHAHVNLSSLHSELAQRGARIRKTPFQVPWQTHVHQLEVEDLDGNLLIFWGDLP